MKNRQAIDTLQDVLEHEYSALISRDFAKLADLLAKKQTAFETLSIEGLRKNDLVGLNQKLHRNQSLLDATARGIRAAQRKIDLASDIASSVRYNRFGKKMPTRQGAGSTSRRA